MLVISCRLRSLKSVIEALCRIVEAFARRSGAIVRSPVTPAQPPTNRTCEGTNE